MARNVYDFDDAADDEQQLNVIAKKLQAKTPKDVLLKLLKRAGTILEGSSQEEDAQQQAAAIAQALKAKAMVDHKDKDVRIRTAFCLTQILRIYAPDSPYTNSELQDVFGTMLWVFRWLDKPDAPSFHPCLTILEVLSQVKCCLLMWDFEDDSYVCDLFKVLLDSVNGDNIDAVEPAVLELLVTMLEESEDISQQLLDIILSCLLKPNSEEHQQAYRVAQHLLKRTERWIQPHLQKFLTNVITGVPTESSLDDPQNLLSEVHQACPQALLPVLPHLVSELQAESQDRRLLAIDLLVNAFSGSDSAMDVDYSDLFEELLRRCCDKQAEVRKHVVEQCPRLLRSCTSAKSRNKVLLALKNRILDSDDRVRMVAVTAICNLASINLQLVTQDILFEISERLRDKKLTVRKETASQLLLVFRAYCMRRNDGHDISADEELVLWIPSRVLGAAARDLDLGSHVYENLLRTGLFPTKLPMEDAARQLAIIYAQAEKQERESILRAVKSREVLRQLVLKLVSVRAGSPGTDVGLSDGKTANILRRIASFFSRDSKAEEALTRICQLRDNHIFKGLASLCVPDITLEAAAPLAKDVVQRIGSRGFVGDMARGICLRLSPQVISSGHLSALLKVAEGEADDEDGAYLSGVLNLLVDTSKISPSLFSQLGAEVRDMLLKSTTSESQLAAVTILEHAGPLMHEHNPLDTSLQKKLLNMCTSGTVPQAKHALRALVALLGIQKASGVVKPVAQRVAAALANGNALGDRKLCVMLQTLSSIGRVLPHVFAPHASAMGEFVLQTLLLAEPEDVAVGRKSAHGDANALPSVSRHWERVSNAIRVKAFGLKALARAAVPDVQPRLWEVSPPGEVSGAVDSLVDQLAGMMDPSLEMDEFHPANDADRGYLRLTAATAMLRLARGHDPRILSETYFSLALTMQDTMADVRSTFAAKVSRALVVLQAIPGTRPAKYAAILPLAGADPSLPNREAGMRALVDYIQTRRRAAITGAAALVSQGSSGGTILQEYPDFLLVYLVQILAHHPDFPDPEDEDFSVDAYQPFATMLQCALEPLLHPWTSAEAPGAVLPAIMRIMRTIKGTEDVTDVPATENVYILADISMAIADAIVKRQAPDAPPPAKFPGLCPLPKSFYRALDTKTHGKARDGSHLPVGWEVHLEENILPTSPVPPVKPAAPGQKQGDGRGEVSRKRGHVNAGLDQQHVAKKRRPTPPNKPGAAKKSPRQPSAKYESESELEASSATDESDADVAEAREGEVAGRPQKQLKAAALPAKQKGGRPIKEEPATSAEPRVDLMETSPQAKVASNPRRGMRRGLESEDLDFPSTAATPENGGEDASADMKPGKHAKRSGRAPATSPLILQEGGSASSSPAQKKRGRAPSRGVAEPGKRTSNGNLAKDPVSATKSGPSGGDVRPSPPGPRNRPPQGFLKVVRASLATKPGGVDDPSGMASSDEEQAATATRRRQPPGHHGKGGAKAAKSKSAPKVRREEKEAIMDGENRGRQAKPALRNAPPQREPGVGQANGMMTPGNGFDAPLPLQKDLRNALGGREVAVVVEPGFGGDQAALPQAKKRKPGAKPLQVQVKPGNGKVEAAVPAAANGVAGKQKGGSNQGQSMNLAKRKGKAAADVKQQDVISHSSDEEMEQRNPSLVAHTSDEESSDEEMREETFRGGQGRRKHAGPAVPAKRGKPAEAAGPNKKRAPIELPKRVTRATR